MLWWEFRLSHVKCLDCWVKWTVTLDWPAEMSMKGVPDNVTVKQNTQWRNLGWCGSRQSMVDEQESDKEWSSTALEAKVRSFSGINSHGKPTSTPEKGMKPSWLGFIKFHVSRLVVVNFPEFRWGFLALYFLTTWISLLVQGSSKWRIAAVKILQIPIVFLY